MVPRPRQPCRSRPLIPVDRGREAAALGRSRPDLAAAGHARRNERCRQHGADVDAMLAEPIRTPDDGARYDVCERTKIAGSTGDSSSARGQDDGEGRRVGHGGTSGPNPIQPAMYSKTAS